MLIYTQIAEMLWDNCWYFVKERLVFFLLAKRLIAECEGLGRMADSIQYPLVFVKSYRVSLCIRLDSVICNSYVITSFYSINSFSS